MSEERFSFEDLEVLREAVDFDDPRLEVTGRIEVGKGRSRPIDQLEGAAASPASNIAEGKRALFEKGICSISLLCKGVAFRDGNAPGTFQTT